MVTKGHDFPGVTLVGVLSPDQAMNLPDFRAAERTFQLLEQVAGRAGRGDRPGRVMIQTYTPDHPAIAAVRTHDYEGFARGELATREETGYPPFARMVASAHRRARRRRGGGGSAHGGGRVARRPGVPTVRVRGPAAAPLVACCAAARAGRSGCRRAIARPRGARRRAPARTRCRRIATCASSSTSTHRARCDLLDGGEFRRRPKHERILLNWLEPMKLLIIAGPYEADRIRKAAVVGAASRRSRSSRARACRAGSPPAARADRHGAADGPPGSRDGAGQGARRAARARADLPGGRRR